MGGEVLWVMRGLAEDGMIMMVISHDMGAACNAGDRMNMMDAGRMARTGPRAKVPANPQVEGTRTFL